jgi:YHS domain-containing protein
VIAIECIMVNCVKEEKMKDLVCNMDVKESSEFRSTYKGRVYAFCSASCKKSFDKNPRVYVKS